MTQLDTQSQGPSSSTLSTPRHEAQIGTGLAPGRNLTVLNLLLALVQDEESVVRIDDAEYVRAAPRRVDPQIVGTGSERYVVVDGVRSSNEYFNFSLKGEQTVLVREQEGRRPTPKLVLRTYNVVRDGKLAMSSLNAILGERSFVILRDAGRLSLEGRQLEAGEARDPNAYYTIRLEGLRLVSPDWARPEQQRLADLLKEEADLCHARGLLQVREADPKLPEGLPLARTATVSLPYHRSKKTEEEDATGLYEAKRVIYKLAEYTPKPFDATKYVDRATVREALQTMRRQLALLRFRIRAIIFAIESCTTGTPLVWSDPLKVHKTKNPRTVRSITLDGTTIQRIESTISIKR